MNFLSNVITHVWAAISMLAVFGLGISLGIGYIINTFRVPKNTAWKLGVLFKCILVIAFLGFLMFMIIYSLNENILYAAK
jgi:hypothetical protein